MTFAPGETSKTVAIKVHGDATVEPDEDFSLEISDPTGAVISGVSSRATATILNDDRDPPRIELLPPNLAMYEGDERHASREFGVSLSKAYDLPVTVKYQTQDKTATAGVDYEPVSGTLTFAPGETQKTASIEVIGDTLFEETETVRLLLSEPVNGVISDGSAGAILTIYNDDPLVPVLSLSQDSIVVPEGDAGSKSIDIRVKLSPPATVPVTVNYAALGGTAVAGSDFVADTGTFTIPAGEVSGTIRIKLFGDRDVEPDESFRILLSDPFNAPIEGPNLVTVTILNDDTLVIPSGLFTFATAGFRASEADGQAFVTITRTDGSAAGASVVLSTSDGSAKAGVNYKGVSKTITFLAGQTQQTVAIPILGDGKFTGQQALGLTLSRPGGGASLGAISRATLSIDEADPRPFARARQVALTYKQKAVSAIVVDFDTPLDAPSASIATNYRLALLNAQGKPVKPYTIASAAYDAGRKRLTLTLKKAIAWSGRVQLTAPGVKDAFKRPFGGSPDAPVATLTRIRGKISIST